MLLKKVPKAMANKSYGQPEATACPSPIIFLYDDSDLDEHVTTVPVSV